MEDGNGVPIHDGRGPVAFRVQKDPDAVKDYRIAWGNWLRSGETIVTSSWVSDGVFVVDSTDSLASETIGSITYTAIEVAWLSGGTPDAEGLLTNRITTNQGRTEERSFRLVCREQ